MLYPIFAIVSIRIFGWYGYRTAFADPHLLNGFVKPMDDHA